MSRACGETKWADSLFFAPFPATMGSEMGKKSRRYTRKHAAAGHANREAGLVRLADVLPQLIARYGIQQQGNIEKIAEAWKEAVGEPYAAVTRVAGLRRGVLEIAVPHNAFIQELSFRQTELLAAVRKAVAEVKIGKLKFVVE